jgi:hypothetical protein
VNRMTGWRLMTVCAGLLLARCSNDTPALVDIAQVPIPTKGEIAQAPTVPICSVAGRSPRHVGELVRIKGNLSIVDGRFVLLGAECRAPLLVMFDGEVAQSRDFREVSSEMSTRLKYRAQAVVVGRVNWSRNGYIRSDGSTLKHPGAMLSIHAVERVKEPRPTAEEVAHARTLPFCTIAEGDVELDGQLVRVKATYGVVGFHSPNLYSPTNEQCGAVSLSFDKDVEQFTPDFHNKMRGLHSWRDEITMVGRVDLHRPWMMGQWGVTLTVFAIDRVEPRN